MIHEIVQSILERGLPELTRTLENIYLDGYEQAHDDTVESCYGNQEEKAKDNIENNRYVNKVHYQLTKVLTEVFGKLVDKDKVAKIIYCYTSNCGGLKSAEENWDKNLMPNSVTRKRAFRIAKTITDRNIEILKGDK